MGIRFGLFADLHSSLPGTEARGSSMRTADDLRKGMARFADAGASFAVCLGDCLQPAHDRAEQYEQMKALVRDWSGYGFPVHIAPGNHEFQQLSFPDYLEIFQTDRTWYSFLLGGNRFVFLDTAFNPDGTHFSEDNFDWRFAKIPDAEVSWLKKLLSVPARTFVFTHYNLYFTPGEAEAEWYQAENHAGIRAILEESDCVEAVFQAHLHEFRSLSLNGIRYVTVPSPERSPEYSPDDFPLVEILESGFLYNGKVL